MNAAGVETTVEADGELRLTELPCRRGGKVEAIIRLVYNLYWLTNAEIWMAAGGTAG